MRVIALGESTNFDSFSIQNPYVNQQQPFISLTDELFLSNYNLSNLLLPFCIRCLQHNRVDWEINVRTSACTLMDGSTKTLQHKLELNLHKRISGFYSVY